MLDRRFRLGLTAIFKNNIKTKVKNVPIRLVWFIFFCNFFVSCCFVFLTNAQMKNRKIFFLLLWYTPGLSVRIWKCNIHCFQNSPAKLFHILPKKSVLLSDDTKCSPFGVRFEARGGFHAVWLVLLSTKCSTLLERDSVLQYFYFIRRNTTTCHKILRDNPKLSL